jgi:hypothetical protein
MASFGLTCPGATHRFEEDRRDATMTQRETSGDIRKEDSMTHEDAGHYAKKHPDGTVVRDDVVAAVKEKLLAGKMTCTDAHAIAAGLQVSPREVGVAIDLLEGKLEQCQLGLFGYGTRKKIVAPMSEVRPELEKAIRDAVVDGRLSCAACWQVAAQFGLPKMKLSAACERLGIKISSCQLGAF